MKKIKVFPGIIILVCLVCIVVTTALFIKGMKLKTETPVPDINNSGAEIKVESDLSESIYDKKSKDYIIKLKEEMILAYVKADNGKYKLWNSTPASPDLSSRERKNLENGIVVNSFEELCFYFEAYSS